MKSKTQAEVSGMQREHRLHQDVEVRGRVSMTLASSSYMKIPLECFTVGCPSSRPGILTVSFLGGGLSVSVGDSASLKEASRPLSSEQGWMGIYNLQTSASPYALLFSQV